MGFDGNMYSIDVGASQSAWIISLQECLTEVFD